MSYSLCFVLGLPFLQSSRIGTGIRRLKVAVDDFNVLRRQTGRLLCAGAFRVSCLICAFCTAPSSLAPSRVVGELSDFALVRPAGDLALIAVLRLCVVV